MSCWEMAVVAAKIAVSEPKIKHQLLNILIPEYSGPSRISKKIPATTIVELWRSAETGVGPSIAAGSQGCKPNWADFPAAAIKAPSKRRLYAWEDFFPILEISEMDQELNRVILKEKNKRIPMSPIRL